MPLTSMNILKAGMALYSPIGVMRASLSNALAGVVMSTWRTTGSPPQGAIPTTAATPINTTVGALTPIPVPGTGQDLHLTLFDINASVAGGILIYDRLGHMGGLNGTLATAQTVNLGIATPAAANRCNADGSNVEWFLEWYGDTGATPVTATISYTNQASVSGRTTTVALPATCRASSCRLIAPAGGDTSIRSIETVTLSATTGTAGNFGVTARLYLGAAHIAVASEGRKIDPFDLGLRMIQPTSCIEFVVFPTATTTGVWTGTLQIVSV